MGTKIYNRFEILKESAGSPGNMVYKAQDLDGSILQLLEWTPDQGVLAASATKLNDAIDELAGVEVFSSGPSLYIASASGDSALAALRKLRLSGLFSGQWPGLGEQITEPIPEQAPEPVPDRILEQPVPSPAPPPVPVVKPQNQVAKRSGWLKAAIIAVAVILLAVAGGMAWIARNNRIAEEQRQMQLKFAALAERQRLEDQRKLDAAKAEAQKQKDELQERIRQAELQHQADLANERKQKEDANERLRLEQERERRRVATAKAEQAAERKRQAQERERHRIEIAQAERAQKQKDDLEKRQELERREQENAKIIRDSFARSQTALATGLSNRYHRIRLINKCASVAINVAIRFQSLDNAWVTQGWWTVEPHQEKVAPLVYSQNATFYFYAEGGSQVWVGQDSNAIDMEVVENAFTHMADPILGKNRRVVKAIRRDFPSGYGEHPVPFDCPN